MTLPIGTALPQVGHRLDVRIDGRMAGATVTAIDDTHITLDFDGGAAPVKIALSWAVSIDWYPHAGQA